MFRTASAFGAREVILCGITPGPPRADLAKVALGSELLIPWRYLKEPLAALEPLARAGRNIRLLDTGPESQPLPARSQNGDEVLVLGAERGGLDESLVRRFGPAWRIPHPGPKESLNVSVAAGIAAWWALAG